MQLRPTDAAAISECDHRTSAAHQQCTSNVDDKIYSYGDMQSLLLPTPRQLRWAWQPSQHNIHVIDGCNRLWLHRFI
jgi:hypothetical protein